MRGLIRSFVVIIDLSQTGLAPRDFEIPRIRLITSQLRNFFSSFLDQNPLSQLSIVSTFGSRAKVHTFLSGDLQLHLQALKDIEDLEASGEPSLQNSIQTATRLLQTSPPFATREILLIYGSYATCDPAPLDSLLAHITSKDTAAVISAIGLGARCHALERIAATTGGNYRVPTSPSEFEDLLAAHVQPPAWSEKSQRIRFIPFGFAKPSGELHEFDPRELKAAPEEAAVKLASTICPRCQTAVFTTPSYCPCCQMLLMAPAHLTRSLHHLKPLQDFQKIEGEGYCIGCHVVVEDGGVSQCGICGAGFCKACDKFVHDCLQNCPGCLEGRQKGAELS
jgi:transcription initiation factor TFIIH subunit 2